MIIAADWVLPISSPPIEGGAVLVSGARIVDVAPLRVLRRRAPKHPVHMHRGCAILPGLVNAHTHLSLSMLAGLTRESHFADWLRSVVPVIQALEPDDIAAAVTWGAIESIGAGVTAVGDIVFGPEALACAADVGLGGVFFWEVFGIPHQHLASKLEQMEFPPRGDCSEGRARCGISPHAVYSSGPGLIRAERDMAWQRDAGFCMHLAESQAEVELATTGTGPLADHAGRTALGFESTKTGPVEYLEHMGALRGAVLVHCVHMLPGDIGRIAQRASGVVLCPRSNAFLRNGQPPVSEFVQSKVALAIGTDSLGSNADLDIMNEVRALRAMERHLSPRRLLAMVTLEAARVLGIDSQFGSLDADKQADLVVMRCEGRDPEASIVEHGGTSRVEAVMAAGVWRLLEGRHAFDTRGARRAFDAARERVASVMRRAQM